MSSRVKKCLPAAQFAGQAQNRHHHQNFKKKKCTRHDFVEKSNNNHSL
jgi:hypothetical protein